MTEWPCQERRLLDEFCLQKYDFVVISVALA